MPVMLLKQLGEQSGSHRTSVWIGNVLLVGPQCHLQATGNVLKVESRADPPSSSDIDDFILDNMVVQYKTNVFV